MSHELRDLGQYQMSLRVTQSFSHLKKEEDRQIRASSIWDSLPRKLMPLVI